MAKLRGSETHNEISFLKRQCDECMTDWRRARMLELAASDPGSPTAAQGKAEANKTELRLKEVKRRLEDVEKLRQKAERRVESLTELASWEDGAPGAPSILPRERRTASSAASSSWEDGGGKMGQEGDGSESQI